MEAGLSRKNYVLKDLLETVKMSQTYADRDGKKGYQFDGSDPGMYDASVMSYMDRIATNMSTRQMLCILYSMVEREAEEIYNLRRELMENQEKSLALI